ncbi:hypothetical protein [Chryseobacterium echinoideorum]|uniref:hypothetical protein n=1 Tax=Chryseobacterium echinoideorum TaxID=1549648 RepID=UPI001185588B|nr:hypothetical protein [Chryseobacterium echinoideorum]
MKRIILMSFLALSLTSQAQEITKIEKEKSKLQLFEEEKLTGNFNNVYKKNIGKVLFSNSPIERDEALNNITTYTLGDKLFARGFYEHSVSNSILLQLVESGIKVKDINEWKDDFEKQTRLITNFYFDDKFVASAGRDSYLNDDDATERILSIRYYVNDGTDKLWKDELPFQELLSNQELLTPGKHKLKLEQVPLKTFGQGADFKYKPIAVGEIEVIVPKEIKVSESDCFPKSVLNDAKLENEVLNASKNFFKNSEATVIKAILPFDDITILRNEYGAIVKKSFIAAIVYKNTNVSGYEYYIFDKVYDGSKYLDATISKDISLNGKTAPYGRKINSACLKFLNNK